MNSIDYNDFFENALKDAITAHKESLESCGQKLIELSQWTCRAFENNGKIILFGNGGSAADAQHIAAEFVNRFRLERKPLPAIALTTDTSILTAISNDYDFSQIFSKQVQALAGPMDVVLGISTSGHSPNVLKALSVARGIGAKTVGITGGNGGKMDQCSDLVICAASSDTPRIQEVHIFFGHLLCDLVERQIFSSL
ncbi:MAG: phosphoheptose isomerase [Thermodesulfobacteriota bacterium]|nr:MAG: phosphoheptose isomerase [Thermodesulfobacteriota bacterium]